MRPVQIFICIVTCYHVTLANLLIDKVKTNIFDRRPRDFEQGVNTAMSKTKDLFSRDDVLLGLAVGMVVAMEYAPFIKKFIQIAPLFKDTMEDKSDWSASFAKTIANETSHAIADSETRWMSTTMKTIQSQMKLLDKSNTDNDNRKTVSSIIHADLDKMINFFDLQTSLFRKYPLMAGPPLLQLASLVSIFSPLANAIIPYEANSTKIACKMYDTLLVYRPLMVYARLRKLFTAEKALYSTLLKVMSLSFNPKGYNRTNAGLIDCDKDCNLNRPRTQGDEVTCLKDAFSTDDYYVSSYTSANCKEDYARLLRYRVEELFPIDVLKKICDRKQPRKPTGSGWLTIFIQNVFTYGKANGKACKVLETFGCNSYVVLFVNGDQVMKTHTEKDEYTYDVDKTFTTGKILKNSKIKIEVWRPKALGDDKLILRTEGDVNSFLKDPLRVGAHFDQGDNRIETMSFWEDEYEE